ncbi:MAG: hypothetical protein O7C75_06105 [Verrucomicrobia bacterium]|nr:hypothetical protein [Verrucomicrobiota bacterium]
MIVVETFPIRFMGLWLMGVYLVVPCIQIYLFIKDWKEKKFTHSVIVSCHPSSRYNSDLDS